MIEEIGGCRNPKLLPPTTTKPTRKRDGGNVRDRKEKDVVLTGDEKVRYQEKKENSKERKKQERKVEKRR